MAEAVDRDRTMLDSSTCYMSAKLSNTEFPDISIAYQPSIFHFYHSRLAKMVKSVLIFAVVCGECRILV